MLKKIFTLLLTVVMFATTAVSPFVSVEAATTSTTDALKVIEALGIMDTDKVSSSKGTAQVTRAEFAQMLVNVSSYKDTVTAKTNVSLYSDVTKSYWAAGYIQVAVSQGWMSGYLNGSFKPDSGITLAQAVNGILKLLGYANSDFTGNLVNAEIALYESKDLDTNITKTKNEVITRSDCANLLYNVLKTTNKEGTVVATALGYSVDSDGEIDYLAIVNDNLKGPILVDDSWKSDIPFSLSSAVFYKDGTLGTINDIEKYDVVYYNKDLKSVWAYDNKVTGTIQDISPNRLSPTTVTIGGTDYTLGSNAMTVAFSSLGDFDEGDIVTLILGKDDTVVEALSIDELNTTITGIVLGTDTHTVTNSDDKIVTTDYVTLVDASGNTYEQDYDSSYTYNEGDLVRITYVDGEATLSKYKVGSIVFGDNTFSSDGSTLGDYSLAANVKILDYYEGSYAEVNAKRLANVALGSSTVYYYELNSSGKISQLILANVTGDVYDYGVITEADDPSYSYILGSTSGTFTTNAYDLAKGAFGVVFDDDDSTAIEDLIELNKITVKSVGSTTVSDSTKKYQLADEVAVYYYDGDDYTTSTLSDVSNLNKYALTAYYDKSEAEGGRIRVIVAKDN